MEERAFLSTAGLVHSLSSYCHLCFERRRVCAACARR